MLAEPASRGDTPAQDRDKGDLLPPDVLDRLRPADGWPDAEEWRAHAAAVLPMFDGLDQMELECRDDANGPVHRRFQKLAREHRGGKPPPVNSAGQGGATPSDDPKRLAAWRASVESRVLQELREMTHYVDNALNIKALRLFRVLPPEEWDRLERLLTEACEINGLTARDGIGQTLGTIASARGKAVTEGPAWPGDRDDYDGARGETVVLREPARGVVVAESETETEAEGQTGETATPADGVIDGAAFVLDQPRDIPPVWGVGGQILWAEGESLMIAAPPGLGKTTLAGQLGRAQIGVGDGLVLGLPVARAKGPVLYLAMDRPRQIARSLARQFTEADRDALRDGLLVRPGPPVRDMAEDTDLLVNTARYYGAAVVYIDSIKDAAVGLSDDRVGAGYNRARQKLLAAGIELCELHHAVKRNPNGGAPSSVADVYGSGWLVSGSGSVVFLTGDPGDPLVGFRHLRQPAEDVGPFTLSHDQAAGVLSISHTVDLLALAAVADQNGLTAKVAACAVFETDKPTASQVEKIRRRLDKLADTGELVRREGCKGRAARSETAYFPALDSEPDGGRWP